MHLLYDHLSELLEVCGELLKQTSKLLASHPGFAHLIHGESFCGQLGSSIISVFIE